MNTMIRNLDQKDALKANIVWRVCLLIVVLGYVNACASSAELVVASNEDVALGRGEGAVERVSGVSLMVRAGVWPGWKIRDDVTALRVTVTNDSARALQLRYDSFVLVAENGATYRALPPFEVRGTALSNQLVVEEPRFARRGFYLAPHHEYYFLENSTTSRNFYYDPIYYDRYYSYWRERALPTQKMLSLALPEGVVEPDGEVEGFLYFEPVNPEEERVTFRFDLIDADSEKSFAEVRVDFLVQGSF